MRKKSPEAAPQISLDRVRAIADARPPEHYVCVGSSGKRLSRQAVYKQAVLVLAHGEQLPVVIRNLSHTGCRIEYFKNVSLAGRVRLTEPSLPLDVWAKIAWTGDGACGLEFEGSEQLLERIPALAPAPVPEVATRARPLPGTRTRRLTIRKIPK